MVAPDVRGHQVEAGFTTVTWVRPRVSAEGVAAYGEAHWANYLEIPHALYVECSV